MPSRSSKQPLVATKAEQVKDGVFWSTVMMPVVVQRRRNYSCVSVATRVTGSWIALDVPFYLEKESLLSTTDEYKFIGLLCEDAQNAIATDDLTPPPRGLW